MVQQPSKFRIAVMTRDWRKIAGEQITVQWQSGIWFGKGSEGACARLRHFYGNGPNARMQYDRGAKTWVFSLT